MAKFLHNVSGSDKEYQGIVISDGQYYEIPSNLYLEYANNTILHEDIQNGDITVSRDGLNDIESLDNALAIIKLTRQRSSLAVDKDGVNQNVSTTTPTVVTADRVLWDINEDFNITDSSFVVPHDGVYSFDCQVRVTNISNCSFIELAIYKKLESGDDYWFIIDKRDVGTLTELQLSGATLFDFYKDEEYDLRIILTRTLPLVGCSCIISGDDDYTAWGFDLNQVF